MVEMLMGRRESQHVAMDKRVMALIQQGDSFNSKKDFINLSLSISIPKLIIAIAVAHLSALISLNLSLNAYFIEPYFTVL